MATFLNCGHGHRAACRRAGLDRVCSLRAPAAPIFSSWRSVRTSSSARDEAVATAAPTVTIRIPYRVQFGEELRVVGSSPLLGDWSADNGLQLTWTEGDVWTAEVPVNAGHYEFKCVVYNVDTNSVTRWEDGGNRIINITQEPGSWDVSCQWGATADTTQAFTPAPLPVAAPPTAPAPVEEQALAEAEHVQAAAAEEQVETFMALSTEAGAAAPEASEEAMSPATASSEEAATAPSAASSSASEATADATASGSGGNALMLVLATAAAGAVAAFALLTPGGLDKAALGGAASQVVSSTMMQSSAAGEQVRAQVQAQLAALADHVSNVQSNVQAQVSAVQPALRAQVSSVQGSVAEGLSSLQPVVRGGVAYVQEQTSVLQTRAAAGDSRQG